jgi:tetratricopeptide (TPR) repeat protein
MKFRIPTIITLLLAISLLCITVSAISHDAAELVTQGDALVKTGNYSEALTVYNLAISLDEKNFNAWNGKADALNRAEKFTDALAASDIALSLEPSSVPGWINRGYILYNLGRYDDELKAYDTAISFEPDNAQAWFNKGYALAGLKRYDEAIAAFDKVKSLQPGYPNLEANRRIAEQLRDASTSSPPVYVQYAPFIAGIVVLVVIIGGFILYRNKIRLPSDRSERDNRQSRRRKEKQQ